MGTLTIGVDAHKALHVAVAINAAGEQVACWRGANSEAGWAELLTWAKGLGEARRFGVEGAWNYGRGLAQHLVNAGETVYESNARWTAEGRGWPSGPFRSGCPAGYPNRARWSRSKASWAMAILSSPAR